MKPCCSECGNELMPYHTPDWYCTNDGCDKKNKIVTQERQFMENVKN